MNRKALDIVTGRTKRLMVTVPPQHGKSEFWSKYVPSWIIGNWPDTRVILTSYEGDFASTWGRKSRDLLEEYGPDTYGIRVRRDSSAASRWDIQGREGGMITAGVGGPITGKGGTIGIIDDPVKNAQEAQSETRQAHTWEWYKSTFRTRIRQGGAIILIMTRWDEKDLAGKLLEDAKKTGEKWEVLNMPAIAEENDILGRQVGQALCPELYNQATLAELERTLGPYWWNALYIGRPSSKTGGIFARAWWRFYEPHDLPQHFDQILQSWDCSFKDKADASRVSGTVWGRKGANKYLLDRVNDVMGITDTMRAIVRLSAKWPQARAKLVEDKANGTAVVELLRDEVPGLILVEPKGGKIVRAHATAPDVRAGNVLLPRQAPWVEDYIQEHTSFPRGKHSDDVDSTSQAVIYMNTGRPMNDSLKKILQGVSIYG